MNITLSNILAAIALVTTLVLASPAAHAQAATGKQLPGWLQQEVDKITAVVADLKDEQKAQLADALNARVEGLAKVKTAKEGGASEADIKTQTMDVWSEYMRKVNTFLTEAQFDKFKEHMKPKAADSAK